MLCCGMRKLMLAVAFGMFTMAAQAAPDIVPLEFIQGLPFVDVTIGAATSRMLFESRGAARPVASPGNGREVGVCEANGGQIPLPDLARQDA